MATVFDNANIEYVFRLIIAVACGMAIGLERERKNQAAGLRTHIAVILGAALIMLISKYGFTDVVINTKDPARLAAQVVSGIGFLGAGMIVVNRNKIRGLTTAASLWTTAAIGLAIGAGFYVPAVATTVLLMGTLSIVQYLELRHIKRKFKKLTVITENSDLFMEELDKILSKNNIILERIEKSNVTMLEDGRTIVEMHIFLQYPAYADSSFIMSDLGKIKGVKEIRHD